MERKFAQIQTKLKGDSEFAERLFCLETPEQVQSFLNEQGLAFSLEEIIALRDFLIKAAGKVENGELSDEDMEEVAGGLTDQEIYAINYWSRTLESTRW